jgi:Xaa-Pro aminopeptidase
LLIGPSDWQPDRMPQEEFAGRIGALWQSAPRASHAIVLGSPHRHAELAYLTNFVPKLESAIALLSRGDKPRLLVGGGPNMMGAARPLTWVEDIRPLRDAGKAIAEWLGYSESQSVTETLLIGAGAMPPALARGVREAVGARAHDATAQLRVQMARKSARELAAIREACVALSAAMTAIADVQRSGAAVTAAVLAGERAANACAAQDVRTLFSMDGGRTLRPFETLIERAVDPLQVYVAVRKLNDWAEGFAVLGRGPNPAAETAADALRLALSSVKPGARIADVARLVETATGSYRRHPVTERAFAVPMGLSLDEATPAAADAAFDAGAVYSLRVGLSDGIDQHAIVSAMVAVGDDGAETLWPATR